MTARPVVVAILVLLAALVGRPLLIPESFELLAVGRCLLGLDPGPLPCGALELLFWSPGYPAAAGLLSLLLPPLVAGGLVSLLSFGGLLVATGRLGDELGRDGPWVLLAVGLAPALALYALLIDARMLGLSFIFGAAVLVAAQSRRLAGPQSIALAGLLAAAGALVRPEHLLVVAGLGLVVLVTERRRALPFALGAGALLLPYWAALGLAAGRPALLPRGVQAAGFALVGVVPEPWARALVGEGAARLPLRAALAAGPWPDDLGVAFGLDPLAGLAWLAAALAALVPVWTLALALVGAGRLWRQRRWRLLGVLAAVAAPAVAGVATPPGVEPELPVATLLPLATVLQLLAAVGALRVLSWWRARPAWAAPLLLVGVGLLGPRAELPAAPENTARGRAAAAELGALLPPGTPVMASFASSPVVHLAGLRWVPWPAPLAPHPVPPPGHALVTASDVGWSPADPALVGARPLAAWGEGESAVLLLALPPAAAGASAESEGGS